MLRLIRRRPLASAKKHAWPELRTLPSEFPVKAEMTGNELKALRAAYRLSQSQLAKILGVTVVTIKRAERTKEKEFPSRLLRSLIAEAQVQGRLGVPKAEPKVSEGYSGYLEGGVRGGLRLAEKPAQYGEGQKRQHKKPRKKP
jgi:transcriptional regulator with XRE-family HTH domain